jgi:predicted AAA+ superfamily ATPase
MIFRNLEIEMEEDLFKNKVILLFGPRQVGKTTIIRSLLHKIDSNYLFMNGDESDVQENLSKTNSTHLRLLFGNHKLIFIDEAQRIPNIGLTLKIIADLLIDVQVIASGSSALEIADKTQETLTGRKYEFQLFPLSFKEMVNHHGLLEEKRNLEQRLIYGFYPEVVTKPNEAQKIVKLIANSYLYKDILMLDNLKKPSILQKILKALAFQVGSEVSFSEISRLVGAEYHTVEKYIDLLEKTFVIYTLPAFSGNERTEIRKGKKIYFFDNGIRNAIIGNFLPLNQRTDVGALWENFLINERMKNNFPDVMQNRYFWRTTQQQEIDYIEENVHGLKAFEFKWSESKKVKFSKTFLRAYPNTQVEGINPSNYLSFIGVK